MDKPKRYRRTNGFYLTWKTLHIMAAIAQPGETTVRAVCTETGQQPPEVRRALKRLREFGWVDRIETPGHAPVWYLKSSGHMTLGRTLTVKLKGFRDRGVPEVYLKAVRDAREIGEMLKALGWYTHLVHKVLKIRGLRRIRSTIKMSKKRGENPGAYARVALLEKDSIYRRVAFWAIKVFSGFRAAVGVLLRAVRDYRLGWRDTKKLVRELRKEPWDRKTLFSRDSVDRAMTRVRAA